MFRRNQPETIAILAVLILAGVLGVLVFAATSGVTAWVTIGLIALVAIVAMAVIAMRKPRGVISAGGDAPFEMPERPADDGRHRVLVVTDRPASEADVASIAGDAGGTEVFVVSPALSSRTARWTGDESAYADAEVRLHETIGVLTAAGVTATGQVGAHDPLQATDEGLRQFPADEVVYVVGADTAAQWLEDGVVEAAKGRYKIPVSSIDSDDGAQVDP